MTAKNPQLDIHTFKTYFYSKVREIETFIASLTSVGPTSEEILELKESYGSPEDQSMD